MIDTELLYKKYRIISFIYSMNKSLDFVYILYNLIVCYLMFCFSATGMISLRRA